MIAVRHGKSRNGRIQVELQMLPRCDIRCAFIARRFELRFAQTQPAWPIDAVAQLFVFKYGRPQGSSGAREYRKG